MRMLCALMMFSTTLCFLNPLGNALITLFMHSTYRKALAREVGKLWKKFAQNTVQRDTRKQFMCAFCENLFSNGTFQHAHSTLLTTEDRSLLRTL